MYSLHDGFHFQHCPALRRLFDVRDYGAVLDHQEPLPHPAQDQVR